MKIIKSVMVPLWLLVFLTGIVCAITVSINNQKKYQTMEGLGGFGPKVAWWSGDNPATYWDAKWITTMINDLGLTMLRDGFPPCFEDPQIQDVVNNLRQISLTAHPYGDHNFNVHIPYLTAMNKAGLSKYIVTVWTPPTYMKQGAGGAGCMGGTDVCGGSLRTDMYQAFADRCVAFIKLIKQYTGIDVYGISLQNEPAFSEPYESCVYTYGQLRDLIKVVGPTFDKYGIKTRIFMPEEVLGRFGETVQWVTTACSDPVAAKYVYAIAVHGYNGDGATPNSGTAQQWGQLRDLGKKFGGKKIWMTEESGQGTDGWDVAFKYAKGLYTAMKYGELSGNCYWYMMDGFFQGGSYANSGGTPNITFYAMKQFYRYIRPGYVQIDCSCTDADVQSIAFEDPDSKIVTVVILNLSGSDKILSLSFTGTNSPVQFQAFRTSGSGDQARSLGNVTPSNVTVPGSSITTLCSEVPPIVPVKLAQKTRKNPIGLYVGVSRVVRIDGRSVAVSEMNYSSGFHKISGVYYTVGTDNRGKSVASYVVMGRK